MANPTSKISLLAPIMGFLYLLFTLMPDSHSVMASWPGVFLWQVALFCPMLWLLFQVWQRRQLPTLGRNLDLIGLGIVASLVINVMASSVRSSSLWYAWAALGLLAVPYAVVSLLQSPNSRLRLLRAQGGVALAFVLISLGLWAVQTLLPAIANVQELQALGLTTRLQFTQIELQNWAPIGHQNYVAGYLILALPLFAGLAIQQQGRWRWFWWLALGFGLLDLYTTFSRGGWLGLMALVALALVCLAYQQKTWRLSVLSVFVSGIGALAILALFIWANARLRNSLVGLLSGTAPPDPFRQITITAGLQMGLEAPLTGQGLGSVPLLYQAYRPTWGGQEAELVYQLHSTPAQLWAELGSLGLVWFILVLLWLLVLGRRLTLKPQDPIIVSSDRILGLSLSIALLAYGLFSLFDFQLDNICISGTLGIYIATLSTISAISTAEQGNITPVKSLVVASHAWGQWVAGFGIGICIAMLIWLWPVQRARQQAAQGYVALAQEELPVFVTQLETAHHLAPWDPYYAYQLGATLAEQALQTQPLEQGDQFLVGAISWFRRGNAEAPDWEFGHSNLGWLQVSRDPQRAQQLFQRSLALLPAKSGVLYGLGISLLNQGETAPAIEAFSLEILRHPLWMTSPVWRSPQLAPLHPEVLQRCRDRYTQLLEQSDLLALEPIFLQNRGLIAWWQGDWEAAAADWAPLNNSVNAALTAIATNQPSDLPTNTQNSGLNLLLAWQDAERRPELLQKAWLQATETTPPENLVSVLQSSMANSRSFHEWLIQAVPPLPYRRERLGFGILSRHTAGPIVRDLPVRFANPGITLLETTWLTDIVFNPAFERFLQTWHEELLQSLTKS